MVDRESILGTMTEPLRQIACDIDKAVTKEAVESVKNMYDVGRKLIAPLDEGKSSRYGIDAPNQLANYLAFAAGKANNLYALRAFAMAFTDNQVNSAMNRTDAAGRKMTLRHFIVLARLADKHERLKRIDQIFEGDVMMSSRMLESELGLDAAEMKSTRDSGGRPFSKPKSAKAGLKKLEKVFTSAVKLLTSYEAEFLPELADIPEDKISRPVGDLVDAVMGEMDHLEDKLVMARTHLNTASDRINGKLESRGKKKK